MSAAAWATLVEGAAITLGYSIVGIFLGVSLGLALALTRVARIPVLAPLTAVYVSLLRATPLITLCLAVSLGLPALGVEISAPTAAIVALTLNTSSFHSEIWRAGLLSFPSDERDAIRAFGFGAAQGFFLLVLPRVWRAVFPNLINEMTILVKNSPAIAILGVVDITRAAIRIGADTFDPLPPLVAALMLYTGLVSILVVGRKLVERRMERFS